VLPRLEADPPLLFATPGERVVTELRNVGTEPVVVTGFSSRRELASVVDAPDLPLELGPDVSVTVGVVYNGVSSDAPGETLTVQAVAPTLEHTLDSGVTWSALSRDLSIGIADRTAPASRFLRLLDRHVHLLEGETLWIDAAVGGVGDAACSVRFGDEPETFVAVVAPPDTFSVELSPVHLSRPDVMGEFRVAYLLCEDDSLGDDWAFADVAVLKRTLRWASR
jgi:hypothetical protein